MCYSKIPVFVLGLVFFAISASAKERSWVQFDAPAIVIAEPVNPAVVPQPLMGGELMRLRIPVSTFVSAAYRGAVSEFVVEVASTHQSMRMIDFWPKSETYSDIAGNVAVQRSEKKDSDFSFDVSAAYEPFGRGQAAGQFHEQVDVQESFERKPPMQVLTAAGTSGRGYGVFFKFRPGPLPVLEGAREIAILVEVPAGWRGDLLQISMQAHGQSRARSVESLGGARLWIATHREGDLAAAAEARRFVTQERSLRALAASHQQTIAEKSQPNLLHKVGVALDVIPPRIPDDYLTQIVFGHARFSEGTNRLPVDVRVAVLDYWEQRQALASMAYARPAEELEQHVVAKPQFGN